MAKMVLIPYAQIAVLLEKRGLVETDLRDTDNAVWYNKTNNEHYTVPLRDLSPSIFADLVRHVFGGTSEEILEIVDTQIYKIDEADER